MKLSWVNKWNNLMEIVAPSSVFVWSALCLIFQSHAKPITSLYLLLFLVTWVVTDFINTNANGA